MKYMEQEFLQLRRELIEREFSRMNPMQKKAVFATEGPLLILAGAGSGKTTVLVNRIANIVRHGRAFNSDELPDGFCERDVQALRDYRDGLRERDYEIDELLSVNPAKPWQILAITFTNKAAGELKERLEAMLGPDGNDIWASTFHSACARILRKDGASLGYSNHFTIYDTDDSRRVIKECQRILGINDKLLSFKLILKEISSAKDKMISPKEYLENAGDDIREKQIGEAYKLYQKTLKTADAMDFDDIIVNTVRLLEENDEVREHYQRKFRYIMVDEYQDTNHAQYRLASLLAGGRRNICVVGDDDQSIYRFRGATIENILSFENQYRNARVIRLEQNYRSTQNILDAANAVISRNMERKGKELWTANGAGEKITLHTSYDEQDEGNFIAEAIMDSVKNGSKWSDSAVLYRTNAQSNAVERAFVRRGVPYRVIGGHRFYDRKEIKDMLAYLAVINNPADNVRLRRIINEPKRGIGETSLNYAAEIAAGLGISMFEVISHADEYDKLRRVAKNLIPFSIMIEELNELSETMPIDELFNEMVSRTGYLKALEADPETYTERLSNIQELSTNLLHYREENEDGDLNGFLEEVSLMTDIDNYNAQADTVTLMTLHSAKGLEFPTVFIPGMENGIFPAVQKLYDTGEMEEERRLAYVGITRAKKKLYITHAKTRMIYGNTSHNPISKFVEEIPEELIDYGNRGSLTEKSREERHYAARQKAEHKPVNRGFSGAGHGVRAAAPSQSAPSNATYNVGDTVAHKAFGTGVILSAQKMANDMLLEIAFDKAGTKKLMANFAKLTKE